MFRPLFQQLCDPCVEYFQQRSALDSLLDITIVVDVVRLVALCGIGLFLWSEGVVQVLAHQEMRSKKSAVQ